MHDIKVEFAYQWEPVLSGVGKEYRFPEKITSFMRMKYKRPAIYRWNIFRHEPYDEKLIYIGEARELCPQRMGLVRNPLLLYQHELSFIHS